MEETNAGESSEERIRKYGSKKLIEIVEKQSNAYSEEYLDLAKNELIEGERPLLMMQKCRKI